MNHICFLSSEADGDDEHVKRISHIIRITQNIVHGSCTNQQHTTLYERHWSCIQIYYIISIAQLGYWKWQSGSWWAVWTDHHPAHLHTEARGSGLWAGGSTRLSGEVGGNESNKVYLKLRCRVLPEPSRTRLCHRLRHRLVTDPGSINCFWTTPLIMCLFNYTDTVQIHVSAHPIKAQWFPSWVETEELKSAPFAVSNKVELEPARVHFKV